ncbi:MAG: amidase [Candidimonas sp.]
MARLLADPLETDGLKGLAARLRSGATTAERVLDAYLQRIRSLDGALVAYEHVDEAAARRSARAVDALLAAGTDLGPLMGVPVALKDVIAVEGMPTRAGSNLDVTDLIGPEGGFVRRLRQAGCVLVGKTHTVEFAIGSSGTNYHRGTPRNPWDARTFRVTSGSSSGSAVAVVAGLCGLAIGTDTGGSVRGPAAFCGAFGFKAGTGVWPMDGIFPMSRSLDSLGFLTVCAEDARLAWHALTGQPMEPRADVRDLRLGRPRDFMFDGLDDDVTRCMDAALSALSAAGARIVEVDLPEIAESNTVFQYISRPEVVATFGRQRVLDSQARMNPDVADRIAGGLDVPCDQYIRALWRQQELIAKARTRFAGLDAWVSPTKQRVPPPYPGGFVSVEADRELVARCAGPTRPANVLGLCATSQPVQMYGSALPVGLQLMCPGGGEGRLLAVAAACERVFGAPPRPDVEAFAA